MIVKEFYLLLYSTALRTISLVTPRNVYVTSNITVKTTWH